MGETGTTYAGTADLDAVTAAVEAAFDELDLARLEDSRLPGGGVRIEARSTAPWYRILVGARSQRVSWELRPLGEGAERLTVSCDLRLFRWYAVLLVAICTLAFAGLLTTWMVFEATPPAERPAIAFRMAGLFIVSLLLLPVGHHLLGALGGGGQTSALWAHRRPRSVGLEKLASQLAEYTEQPGRVEGIAAAVTEMTSELRLLRTAVSELGRRLEELVRSGAPPVDGVLLVEEERSGPKPALRYLFRAPVPGSRRSYDRYAVELLDQDPFTYFESQYGRIQDAPGHTPSHRRMARDELEGIGLALFDRLLPAELREALGVYGAGERSAEEPVPSLYLVSTESWIPWELLKLRDAETGMPGPFLAEAVAVTRWLFGHEERWELPLREVAVVAPADSDLAETGAEAAGLRKILGDQHPITTIPAEYGTVTEELGRGGHDGWHFAGHAVAGDRDPDSGSLLLAVGEKLTAHALRARGAGLGAARPLVFLNACHSARGGPALTRVGGLAATFLELGAGAFLGTHWAVSDEPARLFAESFYRGFVGRLPFGEAVRQARLQVRDEHPDDPTWLAYAAFGHPAARCR